MSKAVDDLKQWFAKLPEDEKREVLRFVYGSKLLVTKGLYTGPIPEQVTTRGLYVGPAPTGSTPACSQCGRPF
jgi:hypothetical protein